MQSIPASHSQSVRSAYLSGFILAGGSSRRMGLPKPALRIDGESMLERQIRRLQSLARRVVVIGGPPAYLDNFNVPVIPDAVTGRGPLAGIYTALLETRTDLNLVLGCDLPFVSHGLLGFLAARALATGSDVTVPVSRGGRFETLCAVYHRRALYAIRTSLEQGENKPRAFFRKVRCDAIQWREMADAGFQPSVFENMNSPEDYEYARKRFEASRATSA